MATRQWIGGAQAVAQLNTWTFAGTWGTSDVITVTIGTHSISVTTGSATIATFLATLLAALQAATLPEFLEITWSGNGTTTITGTGVTAGVPFTATFSRTSTSGTINGGSTPTTGTATTACTGPWHADSLQNWSGATLPTGSDDVVFADSEFDCLYGLTAFSAVAFTSVKIYQSYTGKIGLPTYNTSLSTGVSYFEYRQRHLQLGATTITAGIGDGAGSQRIMLESGSAQTTLNINGTGQAESGQLAAFNWKGTHASNVLTLSKGSVAVAAFAGETATLSVLSIGYTTNILGDATLFCGTGVTLTTVSQSGGELTTNSAMTTVTQTDGLLNHREGAVTTLKQYGGQCVYASSGTLTTATISGLLDFRQNMRSRTITNLTLFRGAEYHDPFGTVTTTNGFILSGCSAQDCTLETRANQTMTLAYN